MNERTAAIVWVGVAGVTAIVVIYALFSVRSELLLRQQFAAIRSIPADAQEAAAIRRHEDQR